MFWVVAALLVACAGGSAPANSRTEVGELREVGAARAAYQRGFELARTRQSADLLAAVEHFSLSVELDPSSARSWSALADTRALLGLYSILPPGETMPAAKEAALRAIDLDPRLAAAHASLGLVSYLYDWDWQSAERSFRRAMEIEPGYAMAHLWYGMMLSATERHSEAVDLIERAIDDFSDNRILQVKASTIFAAAGALDRAQRQLDHCLAVYPEMALPHRELGFLRIRQGRIDDALAPLERAAELSGGASKSIGGLGYVYGRLGREQQAIKVLDALTERSRREFVPPMYLALVQLGLRRTDTALEQLEHAFELHDPGLVYLRTRPGFDALVEHPGYQDLVSRVGLE